MRLPVLTAVLLAALLGSACRSPVPQPEPPVADAASAEEAAAKARALQQLEQEDHDRARMAARREAAAAMAARMTPPAPTGIRPPQHRMPTPPPPPQAYVNREQYRHFDDNPVRLTSEAPVSTFSIDVDRGSYTNVRRMLRAGLLPPADAVRVEEFINAFDYGYRPPQDGQHPFAVHTAMMPTPWNPSTQLLRIALKGHVPEQREQRPSNLVFLVDVSGSMEDEDRLPLAKSALKALARTLGPQDRISLVVYAGSSGVVLEPTPGNRIEAIEAALDRLEAGGSTNGGEGIHLAYALAQRGWIEGGNNRVLLCTDGDFNVGTVNTEQLLDLVRQKRRSGIALTTLGFGSGNYNDALMERLADVGNGNYAYIDSLAEARRVLVEQRDSTLMTIAQDVKVQVEFNPAVVREYRLIGYENRELRREDFNNDQVDAGEIGAGHSVTALYELTLAGEGSGRVDPLRYGNAPVPAATRGDELGYLKLRYQRPGKQGGSSVLMEQPLQRAALQRQDVSSLRLAAAVAAFGQLLRGGSQLEGFGYTEAMALARSARLPDSRGEIAELLRLMEEARALGSASDIDEG